MGHEALICELLEDPDRVVYRPEVRTPEFFEDYIRRSKAILDSDPVQGLPKVDIGLRIVTSSCQHARLWGLKAYGFRALGEAKAALALIEEAFTIARDCRPCQAYLLWRRAKVYAALGRYEPALTDADRAVEFYHDRHGELDNHDLDGNGLANSMLARGDIRVFIGRRTETAGLISQAIEDIGEALDLADPRQHPVLFRIALFNLAGALAATGKLEDLRLADQHLSEARVLFRGPRKDVSQERARLDWLTGMVRHELRKGPPCRVREMLERALEDFLCLRFYEEASAVVCDLSKIHFPETDPICDLADSVMPVVQRYSSDLAEKMEAVSHAAQQRVTSLGGGTWTLTAIQETLKKSVEDLRQACGASALACLIHWRAA